MSGMLSVDTLLRKSKNVIGLEKESALGGRGSVTVPRVHSQESSEFFQSRFPSVSWDFIDESPQIRKKGNWNPLEESADDSVDAEEAFYLGKTFFQPASASLVDELVGRVKPQYQFRKGVLALDPVAKTLVCQDGTTFQYERLVWCASLEALKSSWKGDRTPVLRVLPQEATHSSGFCLEFEMEKLPFSGKNTCVFPFRFKDRVLRALGRALDARRLQWMVFLPKELAEDPEEVAKCVRTARREIEKDFTEFQGLTPKIIFCPVLSGEKPQRVETLEITPGLFYLGPELSISPQKELRNLDLIVRNIVSLEAKLDSSI